MQAITRSMPWEQQAACKGTFDETTRRDTWIIEPTAELTTPGSVIRKLEICDGCPVRAECLHFALAAEFETFGVWGGSTGIERKMLAPRTSVSSSLEHQGERQDQIRRAEEILTRTHAERLKRWRRFAQEAQKARARGETTFRIPRRRVTGPLRVALRMAPV